LTNGKLFRRFFGEEQINHRHLGRRLFNDALSSPARTKRLLRRLVLFRPCCPSKQIAEFFDEKEKKDYEQQIKEEKRQVSRGHKRVLEKVKQIRQSGFKSLFMVRFNFFGMRRSALIVVFFVLQTSLNAHCSQLFLATRKGPI
jgi:hypothetical protein